MTKPTGVTRIVVGFDFHRKTSLLKDVLVVNEGLRAARPMPYPLPQGEYRLYWDGDLLDWVIEDV